MMIDLVAQKMNAVALGALGGVKTPGEIQQGKLVEASRSFEAMMLNEMLKPLHFGAGVEEGGEESSGGAADTIRGMGTDALGKALASHGGLGIARKIVKEVTAEHEARDKKKGVTKVV